MIEKLKKNKKKGFTLIELVVVIAILGILAALAVPQFNAVKQNAAEQVAAANARTVYSAASAYVAMDDTGTLTTLGATELSEYLGNMDGTYSATVTNGDVASATWTGTISGRSVTGDYPD